LRARADDDAFGLKAVVAVDAFVFVASFLSRLDAECLRRLMPFVIQKECGNFQMNL
jgi:hypothetical protein